MRNPLGPIPSPLCGSPRAMRFWQRAEAIAPPPPGVIRAQPDSSCGTGLGIDRRSRHRTPWQEPIAMGPQMRASHLALDHFVGLRTRHGWALMQAVSLSTSGAVLRHLDLLDASLTPLERADARSVFARIAEVIGSDASVRAVARSGTGSFLGLVSGCVLAKRVVADLANYWARPSPPTGRQPVEVTLVIPPPPVRRGMSRSTWPEAIPQSPRPLELIAGELAPLTDPGPDLIGIALKPNDHALVCAALEVRPASARSSAAAPQVGAIP